MSIEALAWAFNLELPSAGAKLTLLALANFADENGEAYPSQTAISVKTCLSERAIRGHLSALEELGIITRVARKRANGSYTTDRFRIFIGGEFTNGKFCQRQNLPEDTKAPKPQRQNLPVVEKPAKTQRQNLPAAESANGKKRPQPAAESAAPESSLNTTIKKLHTAEVNRTIAHEAGHADEERVCVEPVFPSVSDSIRDALARIIAPCEPSVRQAVLDETGGALAKGTCKNPVTFARALVKAAEKGEFYPALGVDFAQNRLKAARQETALAVARNAPMPDPEAIQKGQQFMEAIRKKRQSSRNIDSDEPGIQPSG